jgi:predicted alpha/beta hydrolase
MFNDPTPIPITSLDGARVQAQAFEPSRLAIAYPDTAAVLVLPAMGVSARFYEPLARELASRGRPAVTVDLRGQGSSSERAANGASFGYREIIELDLPAAEAAARHHFPRRSLLIVAHSLGGQLATLATLRGHLQPDGLALVGAGSACFRHWPRGTRLRCRAVVGAVGLAARILPWYPGHRLGFGGAQPRELMRDWTHSTMTGRYHSRSHGRSLEPVGTPEHAPVLALGIEGDLVAPASAIAALVSRLDASRLQRSELLPTSASGWKRHFTWVRKPADAVDAILDWNARREVTVPVAHSAA